MRKLAPRTHDRPVRILGLELRWWYDWDLVPATWISLKAARRPRSITAKVISPEDSGMRTIVVHLFPGRPSRPKPVAVKTSWFDTDGSKLGGRR